VVKLIDDTVGSCCIDLRLTDTLTRFDIGKETRFAPCMARDPLLANEEEEGIVVAIE
jgi:hypothetical protein